MRPKARLNYRAAGVNLKAAQRAVDLVKKQARSTFRSGVMGDIGFFGGLFHLTGYKEPVLVSSTDGVGTKLKVVFALDRHDTIGIDLVNHCVNDILTLGAEPLFFLDYLAMGELIPERVEEIVKGLAKACRAVGLVLIGGETAQMPGFYNPGEYDLAGFIVGAVERGAIIDGSSIGEGDPILGLPSSGLHTNGYSLVRRVFGLDASPKPLGVFYPELGRTLGEELLEPHRCYYPLLKPALPLVKGMAHITGGGLGDNVKRVLPQGLEARFKKGSWPIPPIFPLVQQKGAIEEGEMYRVFNMGVGMALISSPQDASRLLSLLPEARAIGEVVKGMGKGRRQVNAEGKR